jgi:hydrogenase maturation protein HypF
MEIQTKKITIKGLVQGVGFRPFIYRLALQNNIKGTVENNNTGVTIIAEGETAHISNFINSIPEQIPEAASISKLDSEIISSQNFNNFSIVKSSSLSDEITEVSPDISVCKACLEDMKSQTHRIDYPFTNCTNCGPRFTIIKDLPYDRGTTTMAPFKMCPTCKSEYISILNRRFHAQPVACNQCGPQYSFYENNHIIEDLNQIIKKACQFIESGKILAIKGLGGYHLACNPFDENTVSELRERKSREGKPFALMLKNIETVKEYHFVSKHEENLLQSWRRPIVLLKVKKPFAPSVNTGLDTVGIMLPYMPFHYLLFEKLKIPALVLTSGNISDEPIVIDNEIALQTLGPVTDGIITYNREIHNRTDDSVAFVANGKDRVVRRSRSYAPSPVQLNLNTEGIIAGGAELVNCFCIGKEKQAILSQHIGDLKNLETLEFYSESVERYQRLFRFKPELGVMDMHPDYLSTRFIQQMGIQTIAVQHHHAHIASCMAEHGLDEKVIGVSFDGTGYGDDGNIWGGEFFICDLTDYERINHFEYVPQPGGDAVTKHPWRMMVSYLYNYFGEKVIGDHPFLFEGIDSKELEMVLFMLKNKMNSPLTSSAGRLFDAVSALLNVCRNSSYHAEAPMRLEAVADTNEKGYYSFSIGKTISMKPAFKEMIKDVNSGIEISMIAGKFHNTIVELICKTAIMIRDSHHINKIALSGGTLQNRIILEQSENKLKENGFEVYTQSSIPSNDGGIALGQLAIATKRRELGII